MANKALNQAIYSLLHPISITAIGLLLWNDHWLRLHYPSWWSGKIGDFAWLVFAPFICAAVLAWFVPQRFKNHQRIVGLVSFFVIGVWFSLAKTVPAVHALTVAAWESVIATPVSLRLDLTDLLTLPALWLGWQIWQRAQAPALKRSHLTSVIFALGIFATLASDESYTPNKYIDGGVITICSEDDRLVAYTATQKHSIEVNGKQLSGYYTIVALSEDGGLTWNLFQHRDSESASLDFSQQPNCSKPDNKLQDKGNVQYRWQPAQTIERSSDGGQTWIVDYDLYQLRQEVRSAYKPSNVEVWERIADTRPGPRGGLIDPVTGNIVFAMGWDGVLVRTSKGTWHWASVREYQLDDLTDINQVKEILIYELCQAAALITLILVTAVTYMHHRPIRLIRKVILAIGWTGWVLISCLLLLDYHYGRDSSMLGAICVSMAGLLIILAIRDFLFLIIFEKQFLFVLATGLAAAVLYMFPYILWSQGTIPRYITAMGFALFLTAAALLAGYSYLRPVLPTIKPPPAPTNGNHAETADTDQAKP